MMYEIKKFVNSKEFINWFALFAIVVTFTSLYLNFHPYLVVFFFIFPVLRAVSFLFKHRLFEISGRYIHLIIIFLCFVLSAASINGYYFYNYLYIGYNFDLNSYTSFLFSFAQHATVSCLTLLVYIIFCLSTGTRILRLIKFPDTKRLSKALLAVVVGLGVSSIALFLLAAYRQLNLENVSIIVAVVLITDFKRIFKGTKFLFTIPKEKFEIKMSFLELSIWGMLFAFTATMLVSVTRSFVSGPDALRYYLGIVKYLAENASLPTTAVQGQFPFPAELILTPAFMIGGVPTATTVLYGLSSLFPIPFVLIAKKYVKIRSDYWVILPLIAFPFLLQMYVGEFKIDPIAILFSASAIYLAYLLLGKFDRRMFFIFSFVCGIAGTIKFTTTWISVPLFAVVVLNNTNFRNLLKPSTIINAIYGILFFTIPFLFWLIFYRISIPYVPGTVGLGISPQSTLPQFSYISSECTRLINDMEQESFYGGFGKTLLGYLQIPAYIIRGSSKASIFSLMDIGAPLIISVPVVSYLLLVKKFKLPDSKLKKLSIATLISIIPWMATMPILTWYAAPTLLLGLFIINLTFFRSENVILRELMKNVNIISACAYIVAIFALRGTFAYFPPDMTSESLDKYIRQGKFHYLTYSNAEEVAQEVNKDPDSLILFSSSASFANIYYYIDKFFDRGLFLDKLTENLLLEQEEFDSILEKTGVKYMVVNKIAVNSNWDCLFAQQYYSQQLIRQRGKLLLENGSFSLYEVTK